MGVTQNFTREKVSVWVHPCEGRERGERGQGGM